MTDNINTSTTTTGTSNTYNCPFINRSNPQQGWECPRCGRINAPWISQCTCSKYNYWDSITWTSDKVYVGDKPQWWKDYVTCCQADDVTKNSTIYTTGGSDYKTVNGTYVNVGGTQSNSCTNPANCSTANVTFDNFGNRVTGTFPNNACANH